GPCCLGHLGLLLGLRGVVAGRLGRCGDLGLTRAGGLTVALGLGGLFEGAVALGLGGLPGPGGLDLAFVGRIALVLGCGLGGARGGGLLPRRGCSLLGLRGIVFGAFGPAGLGLAGGFGRLGALARLAGLRVGLLGSVFGLGACGGLGLGPCVGRIALAAGFFGLGAVLLGLLARLMGGLFGGGTFRV